MDLQTHIVSRGGACEVSVVQYPNGNARCKAIIKLPIPEFSQSEAFVEVIQYGKPLESRDVVILLGLTKAQRLIDAFHSVDASPDATFDAL
ncbi:MAG: hypothetical protein KDE51_02030 [Anaerolineales bacterium]|nr:hypothetical protein [Anaerolineales bacterium]